MEKQPEDQVNPTDERSAGHELRGEAAAPPGPQGLFRPGPLRVPYWEPAGEPELDLRKAAVEPLEAVAGRDRG